MCLLLSLPVFLLLSLVSLLLYLAVLFLPPLLTISLFFIAILLRVLGAIAQSAWQLGKVLWAYDERQGWRKYVAIAAILVGLTTIGWIVKQSGRPIKRSLRESPFTFESNNTINLNRLTYTVGKVSHTSHIGSWRAETGESYVVVDLKVKNPNQAMVTHDVEFQILDSEGTGYDRDPRITNYAKNGFFLEFKVKPKSSKPITVVFKVPEESLNQTWTLQIQNKNDKTSPGMIKIGSATKTLAQGRQLNHSFPVLGSSARI